MSKTKTTLFKTNLVSEATREDRVLAEIEKFKFSIISTPRHSFELVTVLIQTGFAMWVIQPHQTKQC
jgi:hypothetical protein